MKSYRMNTKDDSSSSSSSSDTEEPLISPNNENSIQLARASTVLKGQAELNTALLESTEVTDAVWAQSCLKQGANVDATCRELQISVCHLAAYSGDAEILECILKQKPSLSVRADVKGRMPLHYSAWNGHSECIEIIIKYIQICKEENDDDYVNSNYGQEVPEIDNYCDSSHSCTSVTNYMDMVWNGCTALHLSCARLHTECVNVLLQNGARTEITEVNYGLTAFEYCGKAYMGNLADTDSVSFHAIIDLVSSAGNKNNVDWQVERAGDLRSRPLHVAVLLSSRKSIKLLLTLGCDPQALDENGQSPIHLATDVRKIPPLKILANWNSGAIIETNNSEGRTPLQYAIEAEWVQGVTVLLNAGANLIAQDNCKDTPLHVAARVGDIEIAGKILEKIPEKKRWIDARNLKGETPLLVSIISGHEKCVRCFIQEGASFNITCQGLGVLHQAIETDNEGVMEALLEVESSKLLMNERDPENGMTPLQWAAFRNKPIYVKKLLEKGGDPSLKTAKGSKFDHFTPLHIAANEGYPKVIETLIDQQADLMDIRDGDEWLPFHRAVYNCHRDCITIFLDKGANFSECVPISPKENKPVIKILTSNMPRFADYLDEIFDSCIRVNEYDLNQPKCEVTLDYSIILPKNKTRKLNQMNVPVNLFTTGKKYEYNKLLLHPFMESFLYFKWTRLKPFFFAMMFLYFVFVILLTITTLSLYYDKNYDDFENLESNSTNSSNLDDIEIAEETTTAAPYMIHNLILESLLIFSLILVAIQEILFIRINKLKYFLRGESWIKFLSIILSVIVVCIEMSNSSRQWDRYVTAVALLLAWMEIVVLLSRFPEFGYYFQMFSAVALRGLKVFALFGCFMIIGFTLVFSLLYNTKSSFANIWESFMKTFVMMTSELDYSSMFEEDAWSFRKSLDQIFFIVFIFFMPIVTANLLAALAVSDIKDLEIEGKIQRLEEQVDFLGTHEFLVYNFLKRFFNKKIIERWTVEEEIILYPGGPKWSRQDNIPRHIVQGIYDNLTLRRKREAGELKYEDVVNSINELKNELQFVKEDLLSRRKEIEKMRHRRESDFERLPTWRESDAERIHPRRDSEFERHIETVEKGLGRKSRRIDDVVFLGSRHFNAD